MKLSSLAFGLIAPVALLAGGFKAAHAHAHAQADDMFPTKAAAERGAKELKCSGAFAMGREWMPCNRFEIYEKAVEKQR